MRSRATRASSQPSRSATVPASDATRSECAPENASRAWSASARARNMPGKVQFEASFPSIRRRQKWMPTTIATARPTAAPPPIRPYCEIRSAAARPR